MLKQYIDTLRLTLDAALAESSELPPAQLRHQILVDSKQPGVRVAISLIGEPETNATAGFLENVKMNRGNKTIIQDGAWTYFARTLPSDPLGDIDARQDAISILTFSYL